MQSLSTPIVDDQTLFKDEGEMNWITQSAGRLDVLRAHDHFRDWRTLDDERICLLCDRKFSGHDVLFSTVGEELELHCPTRDCKSAVHQWVYPDNPLVSEATSQDWWHALSSSNDTTELEDSARRPSPQPV